jgi:membrane protein
MTRGLTPREIWTILRATWSEWSADRAPALAASLAYYTIFSAAPLLIVVISIAGLVFGREAVQQQLIGEIGALVGTDGARAIEELIANASRPAESAIASLLGVLTLVVGASGVVWQLKDALNVVWDVAPDPQAGFVRLLRERLASLALLLAIGFLLLVSLVVTAALAAAGRYFAGFLPGSESLWMVVNLLLSLAVVTALFALMFKTLPDARIAWTDVWIGAAATALLFEVGKLLVGLYLGRAGIASAYGAAGSLVVVLVWVYYSAQIFLFGAEFTQVYAHRRGSRIESETARPAGDVALHASRRQERLSR